MKQRLKKLCSLAVGLICFCGSWWSMVEGAAWADIKTIRVGLINNREQRDDFAYQLLLGYLREYLDEVSKQNHWQYEYFMGDQDECRRRLAEGELDFVAPIRDDAGDASVIFTHGFSCYSILSLYKYLDESPFRHDSAHMNGAKIGLLDYDDDNHLLTQYLRDHGWQSERRIFASPQAMVEALHRGEIDAILDDGANVTSKERRVVDIGAVAGQFMTTANKKELSDSLTSTIRAIESLNPGFETVLEAEYLDRALQYIVHLTEAEENFIAGAPVLKVAFLTDMPPLFHIGDNLASSGGNYVDILNLLSGISGLQFESVKVKNVGHLHELLDRGEVDLAFVVYTNEVSPLEMFYTNDIAQEAFTMVRRTEAATGGNGRGLVAVPVCFMGAAEFLERRFPFTSRSYATVEECLTAVEEGRVEVAFVPSLYLLRNNSLTLRPSLKEVTDERTNLPISMAVSPHQPRILQQVINKLTLKLDRDQLQKSSQENSKPLFSVGFILRQYPLQTAVGLCLFLIMGATAIIVWYRGSTQKRQNLILQQKNQELQVALANVESMRIARDGYKLESEIDKLTGTLNKAALERIARQRLSELAKDKVAALYIIDLDHFKEANDTYGHQTGDVILRQFADRLKSLFRAGDCVGRFGGDEFVVMICNLPDTDVVIRKAEQILAMAREISVTGKDIHITASIGITLISSHDADYDEIFKSSDHSLYRVKKSGRDGYAIGDGTVVH